MFGSEVDDFVLVFVCYLSLRTLATTFKNINALENVDPSFPGHIRYKTLHFDSYINVSRLCGVNLFFVGILLPHQRLIKA